MRRAASAGERQGRLTGAAVVDHLDLRSELAQARGEKADVTGADGRRVRLEAIGNRIAEREVVARRLVDGDIERRAVLRLAARERGSCVEGDANGCSRSDLKGAKADHGSSPDRVPGSVGRTGCALVSAWQIPLLLALFQAAVRVDEAVHFQVLGLLDVSDGGAPGHPPPGKESGRRAPLP